MPTIVDYLVVVPKDEEDKYIAAVFEAKAGVKFTTKVIGSQLYALACFPTRAGAVSVVILTVGRMTEGPVQAAVELAVREWAPAAVLLVGIAGSLEPDRLKLGDVIVPARVFGFTEAKAHVVDGKETVTFRPTGHPINIRLVTLARAIRREHVEEWRKDSRQAGYDDIALRLRVEKQAEEAPQLHLEDTDNLASGNVVVASKAYARQLKLALGDFGSTTRAVEMEAKGLCEAIARADSNPPALVVRGISDLADEYKARLERKFKDGWRRYAAQNAARFVYLLIYNRPQIVEGYRPVPLARLALAPHPRSAQLCLEARVVASGKGMRALAFSPFLTCEGGMPLATLAIVARGHDDSPVAIRKLKLRSLGEAAVPKGSETGAGGCVFEFARSTNALTLELLVSLPAEAAKISAILEDEFGRRISASWPD